MARPFRDEPRRAPDRLLFLEEEKMNKVRVVFRDDRTDAWERSE